MGDGETGGEEGVVLGTYFRVLSGMQEQAVEATNAVLAPCSKG